MWLKTVITVDIPVAIAAQHNNGLNLSQERYALIFQ